jgi:hypothetical protein
MRSGMWNLGFGIVGILAGATGEFTFFGTNSTTLLIVVGSAVAALGVFQLWRARGT